MTKPLDQLANLTWMAGPTRLAKLLHQLVKLTKVAEPKGMAERAKPAELTGPVDWVELSRLEPHVVLLGRRMTG
ncbi:MAG: hypothetical protein ACRDRG_13755 [Pseudonocardiaceae bacterium]